MLAVRFHGIGDVRTEQVDDIVPEENQALIDVLYGGICGSDLHIFRKGMFVERLGEIMGHEFTGRIRTAPAGSGLSAGDLVVGDPRVPCGRCTACRKGDTHRCASLGFIGEVRPGCFAQLLALEPEKLIRLPPETDPVQAAVSEPLAVAVHACRAIAAGSPESVLVTGAGPIGLLTAFLLKHEYGIPHVAAADRDILRLEMAEQAGADELVKDLSLVENRFDCAVDAVGAEVTLNSSLAAVLPGGTVFVSAIYETLPVVDVNAMVSAEKQLRGNNAYSFQDLQEAARLIGEGRLDLRWLITSVLPAREAPQAFSLLTAPEKRDLKILLDFQHPEGQ